MKGMSLLLILATAAIVLAQIGTTTTHIIIDQFGYRPNDQKIAVISNPQQGFNADDHYSPGSTLEVHRVEDNLLVFSGSPVAWNNGSVHAQSGDQVWWFDFSALTAPGNYFIYDPQNDASSYVFTISDNVYQMVLKHAMRTYYYQRCGTPKQVPYAHPNWTDVACHIGANQDLDCRLVTNPVDSTSRNLSGGWHDAGDYNKYINYADAPIHDLLFAYQERPNLWTDDFGIPESGNGIPDILDEVKWELDWFLKMQNSDGSVLHKVSVTNWQSGCPPSTDDAARYYAPATASATISACGAFAHAAIVFQELSDASMQAYADTLRNAAIAAWNWLEAHPDSIPSHYNNAGFSSSAAEDNEYRQQANRIAAAGYLAILTGEAVYRDYFENNYTSLHLMQWGWASPFERVINDAALYYASSTIASASVATDIRTEYRNSLRDDFLPHFTDGDDAYRAYLSDGNYTWGSNRTKANMGNMYMNILVYDLDTPDSSTYRKAAAGYLHYLHGINPFAYVYLSNMGDYGAENSIPEFYHGWFHDGSVWDNANTSLYGPAPGFVPGGPNPNYSPDPSYSGPPIEPPQNQPIQKSFRAWNTGWPENSWEVTENHIPNQSAYVKLLSKFTRREGSSSSASRLYLKLFLEGAYCATGDSMNTDLKRSGKLPVNQPYQGSPWNYAGSESVSSFPEGTVDWVLVELRSGTESATRVDRRAALLKQNGLITDLDGTSPVQFENAAAGFYYLVVYHRNHLAVMSAEAVFVASEPVITYDFTTSADRAYQTNGAATKEVEPGVWALFAGDANGDGCVNQTDKTDEWLPDNGQPWSYSRGADFNLDGAIDAVDFNQYLLPNQGVCTQVP